MIPVRPYYVLASALALLVNLTGCASIENMKPPPPQKQAVTLKIATDGLSSMSDLPVGVYRIPDSQVIISGHQQGSGMGLLFGVIGIAIANATNAGAGADAIKTAETKLHIKLDAQVDASIKNIIASDKFNTRFTQNDMPGNGKIFITPALILTYVSENDIRPFMLLKAVMIDSDGKQIWTTRYFASTGEARPLIGKNGWLENDGVDFKSVIQTNLMLAMQTMAADVVAPFPRNKAKLITVQGNFPYLKPRFQMTGFLLDEDDRYLTFMPNAGDGVVFSGIHILDKSGIKYRSAAKEDPSK